MCKLKIRGCPFCGKTPTVKKDVSILNGMQYYVVTCTHCYSSGPGNFEKEAAIVAWNTRHLGATDD